MERDDVIDVASRPDLEPAPRTPVGRAASKVVRSAYHRPLRQDRAPVRRRGWGGRGTTGLVAVAPPQYMRKNDGTPVAADGSTLWRFLSGAELDGKQRTNATWFRWATRQYIWAERPPSTTWVSLPRLLRAAVRLAGALVAVVVLAAYMRHPAAVTWVAGIVTWAVLFAAGWAGGDSLLTWGHRRRWVWPLHHAIVGVLGYHPRIAPRLYLWLPTDFRQRGFKVALPTSWTGADEESDRTDEGERKARAVVAIARTKLALSDIVTEWSLTSTGHELTVTPKIDLIPQRMMYDPGNETIKAWYAETPETAFLLGAGSDGPLRWDLDDDAPHLLLSMLSGEGKSVLLRLIIAQALHRGGRVTILDLKQRSQKCFKDLPDVHYCRHAENMHLAVVALAMEGNRRNDVAWHWGGDGEPVQRRHLLVLEEANATMLLLQQWWDINRRKIDDEDVARYCGPFGDPSIKKSPAVTALAQILFMGRQSYINVAAVGQYTTAHAMGGPEIREMFGARGIKGPQKAFAMLADDLERVPTQKGIKGRIHLVRHGKAVELQVMFTTGPQAREWATSPNERVPVTGSQVPVDLDDQGIRPVSVTGEVIDVPAIEDRDSDLVKLSDVASDTGDGTVGRTLAALNRKRHVNKATFPEPVVPGRPGVAHIYSRRALRLWHQNCEDYQEGDDDLA